MERRNIRPGTRTLRVVRGLLLVLFLLAGMATASTAISSPPSLPNGQARTPGSGLIPDPWEAPFSRQASGAESPAGLPARATPTLPAASVRRGTLPFVTVLCRFPDVPGEPESPAFFERLLSDDYPGLGHYWRTVSYGAISLAGSSVVGWYVLPHGSDAYRTVLRDATTPDSVVTADLQRLAEDCTAAVDGPINWEQIYGVNLVFNASLDRPRGGRVCLTIMGMDKCYGATWIWAANAGDQALWAHEMGHSFGLQHSSSDLVATNDNVWDVMSDSGACGFDPEYHKIAQDPLAFAKESLGWIPTDRKFVAAPESEATITLEQLAAPGPDGYLLAEIPIPGENLQAPGAARFYTVEARRQVGYDGNLPGEAVVIHEVDRGRATPARAVSMKLAGDDGPNGASTSSAMWTPGSSFRDLEHGIAVTVERATSSGFVVTITTRRLPWPLTPYDHSIAPAGEIAFAWQPVPDAVGYQLEITPEAGQGAAAPAIETTASANYRALLAPGVYRWRVRSLSAEGAQPWTPAWEVTVGRLQPAAGVEAAALDVEPAAARGRVSTAVDGRGDAYALWSAPAKGSQGSVMPGIMGGAATDIFFAHRPAGGVWGSPIKINSAPAIFNSSPSIATDGAGNAYAIWIASSNPGFEADVYFAYRPHAAIAGAEPGWSDSVRVNDVPGLVAAVLPVLAVNPQGDAYVAWIDVRGGHAAVYFAERLHVAGATTRGAAGAWSANTLISDDPQTAFFPPSLAADARGNVYLAWQQDRRCRGVDLLFAGKPAGGVWSVAAPIVPNPTCLMLSWPSLIVDANDVLYAVWQDDRGAIVELYTARCGMDCGLPVAGAPAWGNIVWLGRDADPFSAPAAHIKLDEQGNAYVSWPDTTGQAGYLEFPLANVSE